MLENVWTFLGSVRHSEVTAAPEPMEQPLLGLTGLQFLDDPPGVTNKQQVQTLSISEPAAEGVHSSSTKCRTFILSIRDTSPELKYHLLWVQTRVLGPDPGGSWRFWQV